MCLREAEAGARANRVIVDVGAGSLQTVEGQHFFAARGAFAIAVVAPWKVVLQRHRGRDPDEFRQTEYSEERWRVYRAARFQVDSGAGLEQAIMQFRAALREMVG